MSNAVVYLSTVGQVQTGIYGGALPCDFEEQAPSAHGFGQRMTVVRMYRTSPTAAFTGSSKEVTSFSTGHIPCVSVSNISDSGFTWDKLGSTTTFDSIWSAMFDRIFALPFDQPVTAQSRTSVGTTINTKNITGSFTGADVGASITGTGIPVGTTIVSQTFTAAVISNNATATGSITASITQGICAPYVYFILQHEVDRPSPHGIHTADSKSGTVATTAQWITAWQKLYNMSHARATAAGVATTRIRWVWCCTAYGFNINRCDPFYPGTAFVDLIGSDLYNGFGSSFATWNACNAGTIAYARAKAKGLCYPETSCDTNGSGSSYAANWYIDMGNQIQATPDVRVEFINLWMAPTTYASNYWDYNFNKNTSDDSGTGHASHDNGPKHDGLATTLANLGGNPIFLSTTQGQPTAPTGVVATSSSDGTQMSIVWNANPSGDNITGWDVYIAAGNTTNLHKVNTSGPLSPSPRIFTFTGLSPGQVYSMAVVAINAVGRSGFSNPITVQPTSVPGTENHAPSITNAAVTVHADDPTTFDFVASATDPDGDPLTFVWTITGNGTSNQFSGASITEQFTTPGVYNWSLQVSDDGSPPLSNSQSGQFSVIIGAANTSNFNWPIPQPGTDVRLLTLYLRGILPDLDRRVAANTYRKSMPNALFNLAGCTIDPKYVSGGTVVTPSNGSTLWSVFMCEDTSITALEVVLTQLMAGASGGTKVSFHDAVTGAQITMDGTPLGDPAVFTNVDALFSGSTSVPTQFVLPTQITGITPFTPLVVQLFFPTMSTPPKLLSGTAGGVTALCGQNGRRWAALASKTDLDAVIDFTAGTNINQFYVGMLCPLPAS